MSGVETSLLAILDAHCGRCIPCKYAILSSIRRCFWGNSNIILLRQNLHVSRSPACLAFPALSDASSISASTAPIRSSL